MPIKSSKPFTGCLLLVFAHAVLWGIPNASAQPLPGPIIHIPTPSLPQPLPTRPSADSLRLTPYAKRDCRTNEPGCNLCIRGLEGQFARLGVGAGGISGRMRFLAHVGEALPPARQRIAGFDAHHHVEGLARIPDPAAPNWFVLSRAVGQGEGGLLLVQMDRMSGNGGERMIPGVDKNRYNHTDATGTGARYYAAIPGTKHAGGLQMLGKLAVVPSNCEGAHCRPRVDLYDLSRRGNPQRISRILLPNDNKNAYYAAAIRLANGLVYVLVNRSDNNDFDQYLSNSSHIDRHTRWLYIGRQNLSSFRGFYRGSGKYKFAYQNASLETDCDSGRVYLAAFRQHKGRPLKMKNWETANQIDLFQLKFKSGALSSQEQDYASHWSSPRPVGRAGISSLTLLPTSSRKFSSQSGCKMRGGASAYVSPRGNLMVYCGPHTGSHGKLALGEMTTIGPRR